MNNSERARAILMYEQYDRLPIIHFGFLRDTLRNWAMEGHITMQEAQEYDERNRIDNVLTERLGFDCSWSKFCFSPVTGLFPMLVERTLEEMPDGKKKVMNPEGVVVLRKEGIETIEAEVDHLLKGRREWEEVFLPRLQFDVGRITSTSVTIDGRYVPFCEGGKEYLQKGTWEDPYGLSCGSLYGVVRNWMGLVGLSYLQVDDAKLFDEILDTVGELSYLCTEAALGIGAPFDFGHFWEDVAFKNGPLVNPRVFWEKIGPKYRRISDLLGKHDIGIVSVDCDGKIDELVPIWLENGVNTMFPIEVGTWNGNIGTWRRIYGKEIRGVGGMDKKIFAGDYAAIDAEIERLKPLVDMGGYIPCPDHHIPPDAKWENVQYYCDRLRQEFC